MKQQERPDPTLLTDGAILAPYEQDGQFVMCRVEVGHPHHAEFYAEIQQQDRARIERLRTAKTSPVTWFVTGFFVLMLIAAIAEAS